MSREQSSILQRPPLRVQTVSQDATIVDQVAFHSGPWPTTRRPLNRALREWKCASPHSPSEFSSISRAMTRTFHKDVLENRRRWT